MKEDDKLTDAIIDLGLGMKELRDEMKAMRKDLNHGFSQLNIRVEKLEKHQQRTNMQLAEHSLAILKLAQRQDEHNIQLADNSSAVRSLAAKMVSSANLEKRVHRLERMMLK